jgi:hypothetical protein
MDKEMDKGNKKEAIDPVMMEEDQINKIMEKTRNKYNGIPYQYKMNNNKRSMADKEGLVSDEEEVGDIWDVDKIEEILRAKYERKTRGLGLGTEERNTIQITISVEPTTPCATNTFERTPMFIKLNFNGRRETRQGSNQGKSIAGASLGCNNELSTSHRESSSTVFKLTRHDPNHRHLNFNTIIEK